MLVNESIWFRENLENYISNGAVVLNLGSSTQELREEIQPHIAQNIFFPLEMRNIKIYHIDMKHDDGVTIVGDITDLSFLNQLKALDANTAICSNLLEHLEERRTFCQAVVDVLPAGGYLFVSCPRDYPYHPDPVDTMFRPTVEELANEFPSTRLIEGCIVDCGTWQEKMQYERQLNYKRWYYLKLKRFTRMFLPFYKSNEWWEIVTRKNTVASSFKLSATCIVLQK